MINKSLKTKIKIIFGIFAAAAAFSAVYFYFFMSATFINIAESNVYASVREILNSSVKQALENCDYDNLVKINCNGEGGVSFIEVNSGEVNGVALRAKNIAQEKLKDGMEEGVKIPVGSAISVYTAGKGPEITVNVSPSGYVESSYISGSESLGINQTRHKVFILICAKVLSVCGASSEEYTIEESVLICDNIVVGQVPESYVDVNDKEDMLNLIPDFTPGG